MSEGVRRWLFEREQDKVRAGQRARLTRIDDRAWHDRHAQEKAPIPGKAKRAPKVAVVDRSPVLPQCCAREGSTYVIFGAGKIKIGKSIHVPERIRDIQAMSPVPISIVAIARGMDLEFRLHDEVDAHWSHGEWFDASAWPVIAELFGKERCASCVLDGYAEMRTGRWRTALAGKAPDLESPRSAPVRKLTPVHLTARIARVIIPPSISRVLTEVAEEASTDGRQPLTFRQREILEYIANEAKKQGKMPTLRAIGERFGIRSTNGVNDHMQALIRKGWLEPQQGSAMTFSVDSSANENATRNPYEVAASRNLVMYKAR